MTVVSCMCEWASESIPSVSFEYCSTEDYHRELVVYLAERFQHARTIIFLEHINFTPLSQNTLSAKVFSYSTDSKEERVSSLDTELRLEHYLWVCHLPLPWTVVACLCTATCADNSEAKVTILYPHGPSRSFR